MQKAESDKYLYPITCSQEVADTNVYNNEQAVSIVHFFVLCGCYNLQLGHFESSNSRLRFTGTIAMTQDYSIILSYWYENYA